MSSKRQSIFEGKFDRFKSLLEPIAKNASVSKRKYIENLLTEIIAEFNFLENRYSEYVAKEKSFSSKDEYNTAFDKCVSIIQAMGFSEVEIVTIRKDFLEWVIDNYKGLKRALTAPELMNIYKMVQMYEGLNDKLPESFEELKKFWQEVK